MLLAFVICLWIICLPGIFIFIKEVKESNEEVRRTWGAREEYTKNPTPENYRRMKEWEKKEREIEKSWEQEREEKRKEINSIAGINKRLDKIERNTDNSNSFFGDFFKCYHDR